MQYGCTPSHTISVQNFIFLSQKIEYETYLRVDNILFAILLWFIHYYSHDIIIIL